jgi:hypothetical protein
MRSSSTEARFLPADAGSWLRLVLVALIGGGVLVTPHLGSTGAVYTDAETASFEVYSSGDPCAYDELPGPDCAPVPDVVEPDLVVPDVVVPGPDDAPAEGGAGAPDAGSNDGASDGSDDGSDDGADDATDAGPDAGADAAADPFAGLIPPDPFAAAPAPAE